MARPSRYPTTTRWAARPACRAEALFDSSEHHVAHDIAAVSAGRRRPANRFAVFSMHTQLPVFHLFRKNFCDMFGRAVVCRVAQEIWRGDSPEVVGSSMAYSNDPAQSPSLGAYLKIAGEPYARLAALSEIIRSSSSHRIFFKTGRSGRFSRFWPRLFT
jgi:hypothetical protein